jgi:hypothetical protein
MLNFPKRRAVERRQSPQTPLKGQTETAGPTSPIATRKKKATQIASTLVRNLVTNADAKPPTTAAELEIVHAKRWRINKICRHTADSLYAARRLCAADQPQALKEISKEVIKHLNELGTGPHLPQEVLEVLNRASTTDDLTDFPQVMLQILQQTAGLRPLADATADSIGRRLLRASILAEEQALRSCPSLDRSKAIDRVALQVRAFSHAARASVTLRIRMEAGYRALEPAKDGTRDQTRKLLRRMADSLISDSLTS